MAGQGAWKSVEVTSGQNSTSEEQQPKWGTRLKASVTLYTHEKERNEQHSLFSVWVRIVSQLRLFRASTLTTIVRRLGFFLSLFPFPKDIDTQGATGVEIVKQTLHLHSM